MRAAAPSPWPFLLSKLRSGYRTVVTHSELKAVGLDARALLDARLIERVGTGKWLPPGCEHACTPALDFEARRDEGLVGVACPYEPGCWPGQRWFPIGDVEIFSCPAEKVFRALHPVNGLTPLEAVLGKGVVPVGLLARRGMKLPIVWMLEPLPPFEELCLGLRQKLGGDGLVVLLGRRPVGRELAHPEVAVIDLLDDARGDLQLHRALDLLDPRYRERRLAEPTAIFDEVRFEFAEEPGTRHIVRINGLEYGGFQKSDLKFLRLLLLAAWRREDPDIDDGGWLKKFRLQDDDGDHGLEDVRNELRRLDHALVPTEDRAALVKRAPGREGKVRLAVPPANITFDASLAEFTFIGELQSKSKTTKSKPSPGQKARAENFAQRDKVAKKLLDDARKHGVPAPAKTSGRGE